MLSFKSRMKTFAGWPKDYGVATPEKLCIAGFICVSAQSECLTVQCVYCKKTLECWEATDVPAKEHYSHMKTCPLFNMNKICSRLAMFTGKDDKDAKSLTKNGFIRYDLGDEPYVFCYVCGSSDTSHVCKKARRSAYDPLKISNVFFYRLIEGEYIKEVAECLESSLYVPSNLQGLVKMLVSGMGMKAALTLNIGDAISGFIGKVMHEMNSMMIKDMKEILDTGHENGDIELMRLLE
ncbi:hypothetical protein CWI42_011880 [Ordospora colligata]|uniref:Uncharacterized protein n=1 Tax=Ordospora colligata OC4 TaxID=1354746 RepID=A0A0B2UMD5_9MICR|nr:uncharacterized protein M896_011880 [Ordospora colligata OC4]KHN70533.1 hypothetical protein M896_011880 [Ordospora colligata OC4]TBU17283.1 hypothetical protein CWI41_011880 [Ordospora colligata]TBU17533.1 hypothetical protein CWI40_011880 [Ordospora colligata]TBU19713.1 hypothetical protein CWI42_011880 [Ordospora colligata]